MKTGSNVIVFGGSGVIGGAIARVFGHQGWTVGLHYHQHQIAAKKTAAAIKKAGGESHLYQADIANSSQIRAILKEFIQSHHSLNVMVWAVGVGSSKLLLKTSPEDWHRTLQTNLTGAYTVLKAIAPIFEQQNNGAVILVGSLSAEQGVAGQAAYAASKAGLMGLMHTVAKEWGDFNIRVNMVFPGWHLSPISEPAWHTAKNPRNHTLHRTPSLTYVATSIYHMALSPDTSGQIWNLDSRVW
ncbi:MAG: SDR family NAD(P)-dependent oxidoreductase [Nitrospirales bacterium]|nr:SDR family NAD(P)-dependent oxidoreductase [Nitrospirales bacterium]MDR4484051.1 SDR family NAD(P)-dependent oxidoreductase [Nitrospirales bacterium]